jgi:hypothetical protein
MDPVDPDPLDPEHCLGGWLREAAAAGDTGLVPVWPFRLQVLRDDLLPLTHLDGEGLPPCGHHLVQAIIWDRQRLLLAANTHIHVLRWQGVSSCSLGCWPRRWWRH